MTDDHSQSQVLLHGGILRRWLIGNLINDSYERNGINTISLLNVNTNGIWLRREKFRFFSNLNFK